jgi:site-specific DNA-methyltransferase (adenine-specific)
VTTNLERVFAPSPARRQPTSTSAFGVSRRENHDASGFYARFTPPALSDDSAVFTGDRAVDEIFCGDARSMPNVPDRSVGLVVTSPPYFAGKEYEEALGDGHVPATYLDYLQMLEDVFAECARKLEPGGRIAVNVANLGRRPYRSLSGDVVHILQDKLRLLLRGEIVWQKARGSAGNCAWGSFQRPANPVLRDLTERIIVASKGRFDRALSAKERAKRGLPSEASLSRDEFMEATTDVWEMPPERATQVGHPAPFPVELPERLIHLYTYRGDLVVDPLMGSGTTAVAAVRTGRHFAGYDTDPAYVEQARKRVAEERSGSSGASQLGKDDGDAVARAVREGWAAKDVARALLVASGFAAVEPGVRFREGTEVGFSAVDATGRPWLFDVAGGFTTTRPGLRRADALWKAIGKAAVVHQVEPATPLVLLTTDTPPPASAAAAALRTVCGPGKPVFAVLRMLAADDQARLRGFAAGVE